MAIAFINSNCFSISSKTSYLRNASEESQCMVSNASWGKKKLFHRELLVKLPKPKGSSNRIFASNNFDEATANPENQIAFLKLSKHFAFSALVLSVHSAFIGNALCAPPKLTGSIIE
jgi:hypothetical protein